MYYWILCFVVILTLNFKLNDGLENLEQRVNKTDIKYSHDQKVNRVFTKGEPAKAKQFPGTVAVRWRNGAYLTTGNIIYKRWVLTSAHPFRHNRIKEPWIVTGGDHEWQPLSPSIILANVSEVHINPYYQMKGNDWNLCLLRVHPALKLDGRYLKALPLIQRPLSEKQECQISSWGGTELQYIDAVVIKTLPK